MKKSLVALAVAGAFAAPLTAQADVAISGNVNLKLNLSSQDGDTKKNANVSSGDVRVNFAAQQDVGFGEVFGNIRLDADGLSGTAPETDSVYAGIRGDFGTVTVGDHSVHGNYAGYNWFDTMIGYSDAALVYEAPEFVPGLSIGLQLVGTTYAKKSKVVVDKDQLTKNELVTRAKVLELLDEETKTLAHTRHIITQNETASELAAVAAKPAVAQVLDADGVVTTARVYAAPASPKIPEFETNAQFATRLQAHNLELERLEFLTQEYIANEKSLIKLIDAEATGNTAKLSYDVIIASVKKAMDDLRIEEKAYKAETDKKKDLTDKGKTSTAALAQVNKEIKGLTGNATPSSANYTVDLDINGNGTATTNTLADTLVYLNRVNNTNQRSITTNTTKTATLLETVEQKKHEVTNLIKSLNAHNIKADEYTTEPSLTNKPTKSIDYNEKTETTAFAIGYTSDLGTAGVVKLAYSRATQKVSDEDSHGKQTNESENHIGVGYSNMGFGIAYDQLTKKTKEDSVSKADTKTTEITLSYATGPVSVNLVSATQKQEAVKETKATVINIDYTLAANTSIRLRNVTSPVTDLAKNTEVKNNSTFIELRQSF